MPKNSKLLIVYNPWRKYQGSLLEYMIENLKTAGIKVDFVDFSSLKPFKNNNIWNKIKNIYQRNIHNNKNYILKIENEIFNRQFRTIFRQIINNDNKYDNILIIKPEEYNKKNIKVLKKICRSKIVGYIWDGIRPHLVHNLQNSRVLFNNLYSFDKNDILNYPNLEMQFYTNFSAYNKTIIPYSERDTDLFYIGGIGAAQIKQRRDIMLERFLSKIDDRLDINIFIHDEDESLKITSKNINYTKQYLSLFDSLERTKKSKCVLDICKSHHIGLSFRFFDCLSTETKLITNNKDIQNYDFYDPENIMIVEYENDILSQHEFKNFIERPYKKLPEDIISKYRINHWIENIFK